MEHKIDYSEESKPLGTMGPLKNIEDLPENFLVMNGDIITDLNYASFLMNIFKTHQYSLYLPLRGMSKLITVFFLRRMAF